MLIVFEGIDGSGKTTVSNRVAARLRERDLSVKHLRAGGKFASSTSQAIRELGRDARNLELAPKTEFLLYVAREVQLMEEVLRPALATTDVIVADRFLYTPEVLGRYGRHLDAAWTQPIVSSAADGLQPDLVILMDVDPALARARRKSAKLSEKDDRPPSRKGLAGVGLQARLRQGYLELAAADPQRWWVIDNGESLDDTVSRVVNLIVRAREVGASRALTELRVPVPEKRKPAPQSTADALQEFLAWADERAPLEPGVVAYFFKGLAGPGIDERRRALVDKVPEGVLASITGLDDPHSWKLREELAQAHPQAAARSLGTGLNDERAVSLRRALEKSATVEVILSLSGIRNDYARAVREFYAASHPDEVAQSLAALEDEHAWKLRMEWMTGRERLAALDYRTAFVAMRCIQGSADPRAWEWRERARACAPVPAIASMSGLSDATSWKWRQDTVAVAPKIVMATLRGMRDPRAWKLRNSVARDCKEALDSIWALDDEEAWVLREENADRWPSTVVKSLGPLAECERGETLVERQLSKHGSNVAVLKHLAAIALRKGSAG